MDRFSMWWHEIILGHGRPFLVARVSVPMHDISAKGVIMGCDCGKKWYL